MAGVWAGSLVIKANIRRNDMGKVFSDVVEQALKDSYYDVTTGRGQESFRRLEQASAAGVHGGERLFLVGLFGDPGQRKGVICQSAGV